MQSNEAASPPPVSTPSPTLIERFVAFHRANPHVYDELARLARRAKSHGIRRYSIGGLFEIVRYDHAVSTRGDAFKLNNNLRPYYARLLMERESDLKGFFACREAAPGADRIAQIVQSTGDQASIFHHPV
ncbi:MAG: hypothetical protein LCH53_13180 [Bacteroidetes bacterium]|nr:hypothetical protein [Bacteroidota bacterium]